MTTTVKSRRQFLAETGKLMAVISALTPLACACRAEEEESGAVALVIEKGRIRLDLDDSRYTSLGTIGSGVRVEFTHVGKTLMVTRVSESEVAAFSSQCPHAGYEVLPPEHGVLHCASGHGGSFDLTGRVKSGPARSDLERYPAELLNNSVFISYPF